MNIPRTGVLVIKKGPSHVAAESNPRLGTWSLMAFPWVTHRPGIQAGNQDTVQKVQQRLNTQSWLFQNWSFSKQWLSCYVYIYIHIHTTARLDLRVKFQYLLTLQRCPRSLLGWCFFSRFRPEARYFSAKPEMKSFALISPGNFDMTHQTCSVRFWYVLLLYLQ